MDKETFIERLAEKEHASWARWMKYLFEVCHEREDGSVVIPENLVERWKRQASTHYRDLSEREKQSDRDEVAHILPIIQAFCQEEGLVNREQAEAHANRLLNHYGQQRWDDHFRLQQLATHGTTADIYRVEAHFSHIDGPVTYETDDGKPDAYRQVADWLMSEQIQRVLVHKNGQLAQTITIDNPQKEKEVPSGTDEKTDPQGYPGNAGSPGN